LEFFLCRGGIDAHALHGGVDFGPTLSSELFGIVAKLVSCFAPRFQLGRGLESERRLAYGAGLRATEVISLKISDIDSKQMIIRVEQGKGGKDRNVMLSPSLLDLLRTWWRAARPRGWLFPGRDPAQPMTTRQLNRACHAAAQMAEIKKRVSLHTLRHSFATHLLEQNIDVRVIQVLLGHAKLDTTALYTRVATKTISEVMSPLEHIALKLKEIQPPG
jgi:integrase/recombinase XerD